MDDEQLIQQVLRGETQAFDALVQRHQHALFFYLGRMGLCQAEAEDLAQEAFLRAYRYLHRYDPARARFSTWLFTIARRLAANLKASSRYRLTDSMEALGEPVQSDAPGLEPRLRDRLDRALRQLPLKFRSPLALAYLGDLSIEDIAAVEACAPGTVKSRIHRAKQRLKRELADLIGELDHE